jgi:chromosome segregation ATPase
MLLRVIEELRTNKSLLEQELNDKNSNLSSLEKSLQEQYDLGLKLLDENQQLREKIQERENLHSQYVNELENRLEKITDSQKNTEYKVNSLLRKKSPNCKNPKLRRDYSMKVTLMSKKDPGLNKSLKKVNKTKNGVLEDRLMNSEKKLKDIESALVSMSQNSFGSPIICNNTIKARSNSQSLRTGLQKY